MVPSSDSSLSDDALLLRRYVREGSEASFRALAERHLPLIWSTARRLVNGDASLAEDIAQSVLTDFALKAATLPAEMPPAGWLHRHTVFTAAKLLRSESRRRARELAAAVPDDEDLMTALPNPWAELAPHLDPALDRLREADRQAILLRYYEKLPLREVSRILGTTEEAVRKRLDRSLTKLRTILGRRGLVPTLAAFALLLRDESVAAPSPALTRRIARAAWSRIEAGALPATAALPWWKSRRALSGTAAAVLLTTFILIWRTALFGDESGPSPHSRASALATTPPSSAKGEPFPPVTLTATLMTLPEKDAGAVMLDYTPGHDDVALYRQLLPMAAALQKQVKEKETFATTGHPLVILSGPAKPSRTAFQKTVKLPNLEEDPFGESPVRNSPSASLRNSVSYAYPTEFDPPDENDRIVTDPEAFASRFMGTVLDANVSPPDTEGKRLFSCFVTHMFAPPEEDEFVKLPLKDGSQPKESNSIDQPVFHCTEWNLGPLTIPENAVVLAGMMTVPPDILPENDPSPRRLLLFIEIKP